jgi:hypothetical protein
MPSEGVTPWIYGSLVSWRTRWPWRRASTFHRNVSKQLQDYFRENVNPTRWTSWLCFIGFQNRIAFGSLDVNIYVFFFNSHSGRGGGGLHTGPTRHVGHLYLPGWLWGWRSWWNEDWQGNPRTRRKPAPASVCPPQILLDQTRTRTRVAAVVIQRLTATYTFTSSPFTLQKLHKCDFVKYKLAGES